MQLRIPVLPRVRAHEVSALQERLSEEGLPASCFHGDPSPLLLQELSCHTFLCKQGKTVTGLRADRSDPKLGSRRGISIALKSPLPREYRQNSPERTVETV